MISETFIIFLISAFICITLSSSLEVDDECQVLDGPGLCTVDSDCKAFTKVSSQERQAIIRANCGFQGTRMILCCPLEQAQVPQPMPQQPPQQTTTPPISSPPGVWSRKSRQACEVLEPRPTLTTLRILNGVDALEDDFPQFASLGYQNGPEKKMVFRCGGALISDKFVLTAAHCLDAENPVKLVRLGTVALKAGVNLQAYLRKVDIGVKRQISHPNYSKIRKSHDIGLVELKQQVDFVFNVWPTCLDQGEDLNGKILEIAGFGATDDLGMHSDLLFKAEVVEVPQGECNEVFKTSVVPESQTTITDGLVCAKSQSSSTNTCQGDGGSGLHLKPQNKVTDKRIVVGITSFGFNCEASMPSFYTRVSEYLDWIEGIVWT